MKKILVLTLSLILVFTLAGCKEDEVEANIEKKLDIVYDEFSNVEFGNNFVGLLYKEYNNFFAGFYYDSYPSHVVCVTEDAPIELIEFATEYGENIVLVKNSYNNLLGLYRLVLENSFSDMSLIPNQVYVDYEKNVLIIATTELSYFEEYYTQYIEIGMIEVIYTTGGQYR